MGDNKEIIKINLATGQSSFTPLTLTKDIAYGELVADKNGLLITNKKKSGTTSQHWLVALNSESSGEQTILEFTDLLESTDVDLYNPVYLPSTNEYLAFYDGGFITINLTTHEGFCVNTPAEASYSAITIDENENLYANKKTLGQDAQSSIVKIDKKYGTETLIAKLDKDQEIYNSACLPSTHEYVGLCDEGLVKIDLATGKTTLVKLQAGASYSELLSD